MRLATLCLVTGVVLVVPGAFAAPSAPAQSDQVSAESPLVGRWVANVAKSKRDPYHRFQSLTMEFAVAGDTVTITHRGVTESRGEEAKITTLEADGKEHVHAEAPGVAMITRWLGPRTLETIARKGEETVGHGTYQVSADGQTMTATISAIDAAGNDVDQTIVFDRK